MNNKPLTKQEFEEILNRVGFVKGSPLREYHLYLVVYELLKKLGVGVDEAREYTDTLFD